MTVAERPLTIIPGRHRSSGDGVHLVAVPYKKGICIARRNWSMPRAAPCR
jgi:hypothetical protein